MTTTTTNKTYKITSKAGVEMGFYSGATEAEALAAMHRDAGCRCTADGDDVVFANPLDIEICGGVDRWDIEDVTSKISDGFWGTDEETYYVRAGSIWLVQSVDDWSRRGGLPRQVSAVPEEAKWLDEKICNDIDISGIDE